MLAIVVSKYYLRTTCLRVSNEEHANKRRFNVLKTVSKRYNASSYSLKIIIMTSHIRPNNKGEHFSMTYDGTES